ncbi:hypothetical protein MRX96_043537 [Rhipicephalus microplus]
MPILTGQRPRIFLSCMNPLPRSSPEHFDTWFTKVGSFFIILEAFSLHRQAKPRRDGKNRERSHTQPASLEPNEARQRRLTLLYDASQLRADCRRCHVVTIESSCDREAASTCKPAARTGFSPH